MSELAQQLIEKEKKERTGKLDLGKCGLTSFPDALFELTWLEELSFSNKIWNQNKKSWIKCDNKGRDNHFKGSLPDKFHAITALKKVSISGDNEISFKIKDATVLGKISGLQTLDLSFNQISDISFLEELTGLQTLDLTLNQISDIRFLKKLTGLQTLYLSNNRIRDYSFLVKLTGLQTLELSNNQISDISFLEKLTGLQTLDLKNNQISDYSFLEKLTGLQTLNLRNNQISDISFLEKLTGLQTLDLKNNQISDYSSLEKLTGLQTLNLGNNKISDIRFLEKLTGLQSLDLETNQISDISFLEKLTGLQTLYLGNNKINDISFLKKLTGLQTLDLRNNQISDYSFLEKLTGLQSLYLRNNKISDISFLEKLTGLQTLDLHDNQISDISFLEKLTGLQTLDLHDNQISDISPLISLLKKGATISTKDYGGEVFIGKNPFTVPPIEIVNQGREAILNYFEQRIDIDYLFEAKILLVGEERAGKSTIADALINPNFKIDFNKKTTHGIDILKWTIPKNKSKTSKDFLFNIWDFGGQEIYHTTHQFFLTKRSLYLFITESRKDLRYDDFYYWLNIINILAGDSPVILAQNKIDQDHKNQNIDEYRKRFPQITVDLQQISCNTEHEDWSGIYSPKLEILKENIYKILKDKKLPGIGDELPRAWVDIRKEINKLQIQNINFITLSDYIEICKDNGLDRKQALHLSDYFHDLGVFLHFRDDIQLKNIIFINHKWVTKAIYNVFDSQKVKKAHGKFTDKDLMVIWGEPEFTDRQAELLNLMKNPKFKICYQHKHHYYLAPQLFDDKPLTYEWRTNDNNLRFRYQYEFMPKGILSQLIVMMHQYVYKDTFWLHGVLFDYNDTRAIVKENRFSKNNLITIQIEGEEKQKLLNIIALNIEDINSSYSNLKILEEFGCNCTECKNTEDPHFIISDTIKRALKKGKSTLECQKSFEDVKIWELLGGYMPINQVMRLIQSPKDRIDKILLNTEALKKGQKVILEKLDAHYAYLSQLPQNKTKLEEIETAIEELLKQPDIVIEGITDKIIIGLSEFNNEMDDKLKAIYEDLTKTDEWQTKVKLSVPLLNLFGLNIETEFDAKNWASKMYKKHEMKIFKLMGYL